MTAGASLMPHAHVSPALRTRLRRWNFILVSAVTFPPPLTGQRTCFQQQRKGSNQLLQTVTIATSSALNLCLTKREEKDEEEGFTGKRGKKLMVILLVTLMCPCSAPTCGAHRYEDKHATSMPLTLSSFLSQLNTNTNTHTADYTIRALTTALGR